MFQLKQSGIFLQQWQNIADYYNKKAGKNIAVKFVHSVDSALLFINKNPYACAFYDAGEDFINLQFRKCNLKNFPHVILFHIVNSNLILVDAIYAHKMSISSRLGSEVKS